MAKKALVNRPRANRGLPCAVPAPVQPCGRPRAVYRKFGLCRICLREMARG